MDMSTLIGVVVLGIVEGLTEFLPVSSSAHLILVRAFFNWDADQLGLAFDVACHVGTLVAVVGYFRRELVVLVRDGVSMVVARRRPTTPDGRLAWLLVLSAVPGALVGALFEDVIVYTWSRRFSEYNGQTLKVTSAVSDGEEGALVFFRCMAVDGKLFDVLDKDGNILNTATVLDFTTGAVRR